MFDIEAIVRAGGILIVAAIVFAESGLLIGFFLPGDTLLFGAGLLASQGQMNVWTLIAVVVFAAVLGDNVGYSIGQKAGPRMFKKKDGILFRQEYIERAEAFYEKHGGKTIILARFTPIVRTFAPVVAGVGNMSRRRFMVFNIVGAFLWATSVILLGYWLGSKIPHLSDYMEIVLLGVVAVSLLAAFGHVLKDPKTRKVLWENIKKSLSRKGKDASKEKS